jgi:hypothetical protein
VLSARLTAPNAPKKAITTIGRGTAIPEVIGPMPHRSDSQHDGRRSRSATLCRQVRGTFGTGGGKGLPPFDRVLLYQFTPRWAMGLDHHLERSAQMSALGCRPTTVAGWSSRGCHPWRLGPGFPAGTTALWLRACALCSPIQYPLSR